jgi:hypothetical protein
MDKDGASEAIGHPTTSISDPYVTSTKKSWTHGLSSSSRFRLGQLVR